LGFMDFVTHSPAFADFDQPLGGERHKEGGGGRAGMEPWRLSAERRQARQKGGGGGGG